MSTSCGESAQPKLIYRGAEADIYLENWHDELLVRKSRITKSYRTSELDETIRRTRTAHEAIIMQAVRKIGVPVPSMRHIDPESSTLIMEYVKGPTLKDELTNIPMGQRKMRCTLLGTLVGQMHNAGIVHGDLTISNVLTEGVKLFIIDLGLGNFSAEIEDQGVDFLLLNRALRSTHYALHRVLFKAFLKGYSRAAGNQQSKKVQAKMKEIEQRGRYFERG